MSLLLCYNVFLADEAGEKKLHLREMRHQEIEKGEISSDDLFDPLDPTAVSEQCVGIDDSFEIVRENGMKVDSKYGMELNCKVITELGNNIRMESNSIDGRDISKEDNSLSRVDAADANGVVYATTNRKRRKVIIAKKLMKVHVVRSWVTRWNMHSNNVRQVAFIDVALWLSKSLGGGCGLTWQSIIAQLCTQQCT